MKITKEIEISEPKPAPKYHKYVDRGWGWKSDGDVDFTFYTDFYGWVCYENSPATGHPETYYLEIVRTHREDGTPVEIDPIPEMPDHVERVEYFGADLTSDGMGDADSYIIFYPEKWRVEKLRMKNRNRHPLEGYHHYARVWYKKDEPKKKTLEETLRLLPDWLAERAISQIDGDYIADRNWEDVWALRRALNTFTDWSDTNEDYTFWEEVYDAIDGNEINHSKLPDNPNEPKKKTLEETLRLLPDWLAERAISQIDQDLINKSKDVWTLRRALTTFADWGKTNEKYLFWFRVFKAIDGNEIDHSKLPDKLPDNPDEPKKKTLEETLRLLPDWLAERAISQIDRYSVSARKWEDGDGLESALHVFADWYSTDEELPFWKQVFESIDGNEIDYSKLPANPDEPKPTQLSDLIGEDGQTTCYVVNDDDAVSMFRPFIYDGENWVGEEIGQSKLTESYRWSHSPFTKFENANEFVFEEGGTDE